MIKISKSKYPTWIDEMAITVHAAFFSMVPSNWGPVDMFDVWRHLDGSFIEKLYEAIIVLKNKKIDLKKIAKTFPNPSVLRCAMMFLNLHYLYAKNKKSQSFKEVMEFLIEILGIINREDVFCRRKNIIHSQKEIDNLIEDKKFFQSTPKDAREIGKLYNSASAWQYAIFRDFFPQTTFDIYGPYDVSKKFGQNSILVIKDFSNMRPKELWPKLKNFPYKKIKIFQIYKNVEFGCELIGMHSIYKGDIINGLTHYRIEVNGKLLKNTNFILKHSEQIAQAAFKQSMIYENMSLEKIANLSLEWECYQFIGFFGLAGMNWRPTEKMKNSLKNKKIKERLVMKKFPGYKEYINSPKYEIYWLKKLYTK